MDLSWFYDDDVVDWDELSDLYRIAPLGESHQEIWQQSSPGSAS